MDFRLDQLEKVDIDDCTSPSHIQENIEMTPPPNDIDNHGLQEIKMTDGQADNGVEMISNADDMTMTLRSTTMTGKFVQLPPELLTFILTKLETRNDLLSCRQVNKTWMILTSPILREQPLLQIRLDDDFENWQPTPDLMDLTRCLEKSKDLFGSLDSFPCVRITLSHFCLDEEDLQEFFNLYGLSIKSLNLHGCQVQDDGEDGQLKSLSRLLTTQAPNINHLIIMSLMVKSETKSGIVFGNHNQIKLPHLQRLDQGAIVMEQARIVMEEIIMAAPNLQVYNLLNGLHLFDPLDTLLSSGKGHTLKNVRMWMDSRNIDLCEKLADMKPELELFSCEVDDRSPDNGFLLRAAAAISKILESSKDTLTTMDPFSPLGHISKINFPVLSKVNQLNMSPNNSTLDPRRLITYFFNPFPQNVQILPSGLSLAHVFPSIKEINLCTPNTSRVEFWDSLFPTNLHNNKWPSVHTLKVQCYFQQYIQKASRLFPNLKNLVVDGQHMDFTKMCRGIFEHLKGLESLEFLCLDCALKEHKFPAIDSALTGFDPKTCAKLVEFGEVLEDEKEVEKLRKNLSILELSDLKSLKLTGAFWLDSLTLSRVSGIWAFQRMPQLKVIVTVLPMPGYSKSITTRAVNAIAPFVHSIKIDYDSPRLM